VGKRLSRGPNVVDAREPFDLVRMEDEHRTAELPDARPRLRRDRAHLEERLQLVVVRRGEARGPGDQLLPVGRGRAARKRCSPSKSKPIGHSRTAPGIETVPSQRYTGAGSRRTGGKSIGAARYSMAVRTIAAAAMALFSAGRSKRRRRIETPHAASTPSAR